MKNLKIHKYLFLTCTTALVLTSCKQTEEKQDTTIVVEKEVQETFDCFDQEKETLKEELENKDYEKVLEDGKKLFIKGIDFCFYGEEINGITYQDLTDEMKDVTLHNLSIIDDTIMKVKPDYKESIQEETGKIKDFYQEKKESFRSYIGEDTYDKIKDGKENIKEGFKELGSKSKEKVKEKANNWYQNVKNSD